MVVATPPPPAQDCCAGEHDGEKAPPISDWDIGGEVYNLRIA